jgi:general stress protein YciG
MGLATLDEAVRKRIAAMGGTTSKETYGLSFYSEIGRKGGQTIVERYSITHFQNMSRKSGVAKRKKKKAKA